MPAHITCASETGEFGHALAVVLTDGDVSLVYQDGFPVVLARFSWRIAAAV